MSSEKTEKPTNKKLEDAKNKGQVPRSKELSTTAVLLFSFSAMILFGDSIMSVVTDQLTSSLDVQRTFHIQGKEIFNFAFAAFQELLMSLLPFFVAAMLVAVFSTIGFGGFVYSNKNLVPKFSKINPIKGLKNMFSIKQLVELIKSIIKAFIVLTPAFYIVESSFFEYMASRMLFDFPSFTKAMSLDVLGCGLFFSSLLILLVVIDVPFQSFNHIKQLKMSKQEIKDEFKNTEGNPEIKGRRRRVQYELAAKAKGSRILDADVVITNPTHFSVGIKFDPDTMDVPKVVALGADIYALAMREKARESGILVVPIPPLARVLYKSCRVGDDIPYELYEPMVAVIVAIYKLDDRLSFKVTERFISSLNIDEEMFN